MTQEAVTQIANTAAVATVATAPFILFKIVEKLKEYSNEYSDSDFKEMNAISKYFLDCCLKNGKEAELPPYFKMNNKTPVMCGSFYPNPDFNEWITELNSESDIFKEIREMISQICQYQIERNNRYKWNQGYCYDPTNLFLEELKNALAKLSYHPLNDDAVKLVKGRIKYLKKLLHNRVFLPGEHLPTRETLLQDLIDMLENGILVLISYAKHRDSSREHFEKLKKKSSTIVMDASTFLFNVFRDAPSHELNFIIKEVRTPTIPSYETYVTSVAGSFLQWLLCTEEYIHVFRPVNKKINLSKGLKIDSENDFFDKEGNVTVPPIDEKLNVLNWYKEEAHQNVIGILHIFRTPKIMDSFLKLHGQIQTLCTFCHICDKMYELSGRGGDLLLYAKAVDKVTTAIYSFSNILTEIDQTISYLYDQADLTFREVISKKNGKSPEIEAWRDNFKNTEAAFTNIKATNDSCIDLIDLITNKIKRVNTQEYQKDLVDQINFIAQLVEKFNTTVSSLVSQDKNKMSQKAASANKIPDNQKNADEDHKPLKLGLAKRKSDDKHWYWFFGGALTTAGVIGVGCGIKYLASK